MSGGNGGPGRLAYDSLVTLLLWLHFIFFFLLFYWPVYALALWPRASRARRFQRANHYYFRIFFRLCRLLMPRFRLVHPPREALAQGGPAVIVSNHLSLLDPLVLLALFPRVATIVKPAYFHYPVFGFLLRASGYLAADLHSPQSLWAEGRLTALEEYLAAGGGVFIFPEGTRARDGQLKPFAKGAFYFARAYGLPLRLLHLSGAGEIFRPGHFLFNAWGAGPVVVRDLGLVTVEEAARAGSARALRDLVEARYRDRLRQMP
ncbi:MAG: 1-acyl-sn-glycerol-3-phosphate acyltransferase [Deltaproteobacteria bacterium]|nr:1-acyl-sn-glycerol-3-phosphate acyltransferase [Deltaproteobacteria bacterium]